MEFKDWITQKYREWRGDAVGRERNMTEYAEWLGVSQPSVSNWMSGTYKPEEQKSVDALANRYGIEVYEALGIDVPRSYNSLYKKLSRLVSRWKDMTPEQEEILLRKIQDFAEENGYLIADELLEEEELDGAAKQR